MKANQIISKQNADLIELKEKVRSIFFYYIHGCMAQLVVISYWSSYTLQHTCLSLESWC